MNQIIKYTPIGVIHSPFKKPQGAPIQPAYGKGIKGKVEINSEFVEGLKDLSSFSHVILIYHLHLSKGYLLEVIPFLDNRPHGLFSTRAPRRPNPIGLSTVKLLKIEKNILYIENLDIVDGTPLLDIKPYVSKFDLIEEIRSGWLSTPKCGRQEGKADDRFQ